MCVVEKVGTGRRWQGFIALASFWLADGPEGEQDAQLAGGPGRGGGHWRYGGVQGEAGEARGHWASGWHARAPRAIRAAHWCGKGGVVTSRPEVGADGARAVAVATPIGGKERACRRGQRVCGPSGFAAATGWAGVQREQAVATGQPTSRTCAHAS